jgi:hypothetical protein
MLGQSAHGFGLRKARRQRALGLGAGLAASTRPTPTTTRHGFSVRGLISI